MEMREMRSCKRIHSASTQISRLQYKGVNQGYFPAHGIDISEDSFCQCSNCNSISKDAGVNGTSLVSAMLLILIFD
jgi:hypothetical protein